MAECRMHRSRRPAWMRRSIAFFSGENLSYARKMLHRKMVGMEQRVERMTMRVVKSGEHSYLDASMLVVAPAGMAAFCL